MTHPRHKQKFVPPKSPREYEEELAALRKEVQKYKKKAMHSVMGYREPDSLFSGSHEQCLTFISRAGLVLGVSAFIAEGEVA